LMRVKAGIVAGAFMLALLGVVAQAPAGGEERLALGSGDEYVLDLNPPDTKILKGPKRTVHNRKTKMHFGSSEPFGATFVCTVDARPTHPCDSPERFRVGRGRHRFEVQAIDAAGNIDPTPALRKWKVKRTNPEGDGEDGNKQPAISQRGRLRSAPIPATNSGQ
jgi:hypothetical protein